MKRFLLKHGILACFIFALAFFPKAAFAAPQCRTLFNNGAVKPVKVEVSATKFNAATKKLRDTLSGKLATVWRSEWKTKLSLQESNGYVLDMVQRFLSPTTRDRVLRGLDAKAPGFTRAVHARLSELKKQDLQPGDNLSVRDFPTPGGVKDQTFTYYTKPVVNKGSEGKHQLRIRTYLREIEYAQLKFGETVEGFDEFGASLKVTRISSGTFQLETESNKIQTMQSKTLHELNTRYDGKIKLLAPHGKSFKLEVKTALNDEILAKDFPLLAGKHMVQKLDVSLTPQQFFALFAPFSFSTQLNEFDDPSVVAKKMQKYRALQTVESRLRIARLQSELIASQPDAEQRTRAVFNVIAEAINTNPDYLTIEGATRYERTAFESARGFQTTIDRNQFVYQGKMYGERELKNPTQVIAQNRALATGEKNARHVELKVPVTSIQNAVGILFENQAEAPAPQNPEHDDAMKAAVSIYYRYVKSSAHPGKFNYLIEVGD